MMKVKLSPDGAVKIPPVMQQQLGLQPGDHLLLFCTGNEIRLRAIKPRRLSEFYGILPATVPYPGKDVIRQKELLWNKQNLY